MRSLGLGSKPNRFGGAVAEANQSAPTIMKTEIQIPLAYSHGRFYKVTGVLLDAPIEAVLHRSVTGKGWAVTSPRCGQVIAKGPTKAAAEQALREVLEQFGVERVQARIQSAPAAPELETLELPPAPRKVTRVDRTQIGQIVKAIADRAGLTDSEIEAVWRALATNGKHAGRLLAKPPVISVDPLANAAWNGLQPNPWKVQPTAVLFTNGNAQDLLNKLVKHAWPAFFDRDAAALKALNVW